MGDGVSNSGPAVAGHGLVSIPRELELAAFDKLGPACRKVIGDCVIQWSAVKVLNRFFQLGLSPTDAAHDRQVADELRKIDDRRAAETHEVAA